MKIAEVRYEGGLRTRAKHLSSGSEIVTDAPPDNHGRGEAFSPTDLLATSLLSCMFTVMGIVAERHQFKMGHIEGTVDKVMADNPRRVAAIQIKMKFLDHNLSHAQRQILENTALSCPVAQSLNPAIQVQTIFAYD